MSLYEVERDPLPGLGLNKELYIAVQCGLLLLPSFLCLFVDHNSQNVGC